MCSNGPCVPFPKEDDALSFNVWVKYARAERIACDVLKRIREH
jgi:hypothetical protein